MLDRILLRHLTKKGRIIYFVGLLVVFAVIIFVDMRSAELQGHIRADRFLVKLIVGNIVWGGICYYAWRRPKEERENTPPREKP
ncbi:MAG: hypothetical protein CSA07_03020 [Bacteroidia bacterium]|nr:MAG: hypothetical protein CSA07_03020 [Bacteroidia bacterium]